VLLRLRGLPPEELQTELALREPGPDRDEPSDERRPDPLDDDLAAAMDAAVRAARIVALADDPDVEIAHLV
jgi:hypothetical protein